MADSYYKEGSTVRLAADVTNDAGGNLVTPKVIVTSGSDGAPAAGGAMPTAVAPTYAEAVANYLSMTLKGGLRSALVDALGLELNYTQIVPTLDSLLATNDLTAAYNSIAAIVDTTIVAALAAQTTRIHRMIIGVAAANNLTIKRGTTTLLVLRFGAATNTPFILNFSPRPWFRTNANEAFIIGTSTAAQTDIQTEYVTT